MHNLPVEIVTKILREACFDDKATGRSLTLTSKWIDHVVQTVRFEAISICGPSQIVQFSSMLDKLPLGTLKILHLFVSGNSTKRAEEQRIVNNVHLRKLAADLNFTTETDTDFADDNDAMFERRRISFSEWKQGHMGYIDKVLQHVAPSLQTLFVTAIPAITQRPVPTILPFMPNLTDLSCTSYYSLRGSLDLQISPRLRRIHTDPSFYGYHSHRELVDLRTNAPMLEELRVTCIEQRSSLFVRDILACARHTQPGIDDKLLLPKTMKRVILQQAPPPYRAEYADSYLAHERFTTYLYQTANEVAEATQRQPEGGFQLVLLEKLDFPLWLQGKIDGLTYTFHDARRDWQDVISGGKGAWGDSFALTGIQTWLDPAFYSDYGHDSF